MLQQSLYKYDHQEFTPWKINMEPTNHPFRKDNDLPSLQGMMFHVNLQGCTGIISYSPMKMGREGGTPGSSPEKPHQLAGGQPT